MPTIATLSLMPLAMPSASEHWALCRRRLPEIVAHAAPLVARLDPQAASRTRSPTEKPRESASVNSIITRAPLSNCARPNQNGGSGVIVQAVRGDGDDRRKFVGEAHVLHRLGPVGVGPHRDAALGELYIALRVAPADEADHVSPVALEHRRLRLLLEFRTHAPIEVKRAVQAEESHVFVEDETALTPLPRDPRPASARSSRRPEHRNRCRNRRAARARRRAPWSRLGRRQEARARRRGRPGFAQPRSRRWARRFPSRAQYLSMPPAAARERPRPISPSAPDQPAKGLCEWWERSRLRRWSLAQSALHTGMGRDARATRRRR